VNILFIDDTEQFNKGYVGIGGVIFHDEYINSLFSSFNQKMALHNIPSDVEIKWSPPKGSWIAQNLLNDSRVSAYSDILGLISPFKGKIIVAVVQTGAPTHNPVEAKWDCIKFVTERFQFYLQTHDDKKGLIIADFPGSRKEELQLLQDYHKLLKDGTKYVKPSNIIMNLLTTESHLNPGLQVADLVVGITTSMCTPQRDYASKYWSLLKRDFHRSQGGEVMGCGLKVFPKETVEEIHAALFPEEIEEAEFFEESYREYIERMRNQYRVVMSEDELIYIFLSPSN
jgi:hypothetical protein